MLQRQWRLMRQALPVGRFRGAPRLVRMPVQAAYPAALRQAV